jgi:hypothetical protein
MASDFLTDGVLDLSLGMNAGDLPQLLTRGEASYILNGDISNGFMQNRPAHNKVAITGATQGIITSSTTGYFYGACVYQSDQGVTSIVASVAGELFQFTPQYDSQGNPLNAVLVTNQSAEAGIVQDTSNLRPSQPGNKNPTPGKHWLAQAERWVIWDDGVTEPGPVFWDGSVVLPSKLPIIRRSLGVPSGELPPGKMLAYGQGQVWQALPDGYSFLFGDPVYYSSGTAVYLLRDSVLKTSINQNFFGGGNFRVPTPTGMITGLTFTALLDATLGTGPLQVFTTGAVYGCNAPVVPGTVQQPGTTPLLDASLLGSGGVSPDNSPVNGDIIFRCDDGTIRSLFMARRDFNQWGNTPISYEVNPYITGDNQNLLPWCQAVQFDNNVLVTCNPVVGALGVYMQNMVCLSLSKVSSIREKQPPAYNGIWSIGNVLWMGVGKFNGVTRCFAFLFNTNTNVIELHELLPRSATAVLDTSNTPITMQFVSGAKFWSQASGAEEFYKGGNQPGKSEFNLVNLEYAEVAAQLIVGKVNFLLEFKSVYDTNWTTWYSWSVDNTGGTNGYKPRMPMGSPPRVPNKATGRFTYCDYAFQVRVTIQGSCQFMGVRLYASLQPTPEMARPYRDGQST